MKEKIFGVFVALIVLATTTDLWFSHKGRITFFTDLKSQTEVTLQYRKKTESNLISIVKKVKTDGRITFQIKGKTLSYFKIDIPEKTIIKNIQFRGWKKQNITLNTQNEYTGKVLNNRISLGLYNLIVLGGLGYYLGWFLIRSLKYGFPKDDPKLPKMMNIEFLRIVFTLSVVFCHFADKLKIYQRAGFSVEFFFILSGFLLASTIKNDKTVLSFLMSKIIRFLPLIISIAIIRGIFVEKINVTNMLSDFLFLPVPGLHKSVGYVNVAWYINCLFWASLFYFYLIKSYKKESINIVIGIITFFSYTALVSTNWGCRNSINAFVKINMLRALGGMGVGYFLKQIIDQLKIKRNFKYNLIEIFIFIYSLSSIYIKNMFPTNPFYYVIIFTFLIFCFVQKQGKVSLFFEKPLFAKMGRYCLSVYLAQGIVVYDLFGYMFKKYPDVLKEYISLTIFTTLFLACLLGFIVHHAIELPAIRALKKWLG